MRVVVLVTHPQRLLIAPHKLISGYRSTGGRTASPLRPRTSGGWYGVFRSCRETRDGADPKVAVAARSPSPSLAGPRHRAPDRTQTHRLLQCSKPIYAYRGALWRVLAEPATSGLLCSQEGRATLFHFRKLISGRLRCPRCWKHCCGVLLWQRG